MGIKINKDSTKINWIMWVKYIGHHLMRFLMLNLFIWQDAFGVCSSIVGGQHGSMPGAWSGRHPQGARGVKSQHSINFEDIFEDSYIVYHNILYYKGFQNRGGFSQIIEFHRIVHYRLSTLDSYISRRDGKFPLLIKCTFAVPQVHGRLATASVSRRYGVVWE